jgi:hypothetical protein
VGHLLVVNNNHNADNRPIGIITPLDFTRYQGDIDNNAKDAIERYYNTIGRKSLLVSIDPNNVLPRSSLNI